MEISLMKIKQYIKLKMHFQRDKLRGLYIDHMQLIKKEMYIL